MVQIWKIEAAQHNDGPASRQGYVLAATRAEAEEKARRSHSLPITRVFEKDPRMQWPGTPGTEVHWSN